MRLPCDSECARANWCDVTNTEVECSRCGATVLRCEVDDWGCCADCAEEAEREREEEADEEIEGYILQKILEAKVEAAKAAAKAKGGNA